MMRRVRIHILYCATLLAAITLWVFGHRFDMPASQSVPFVVDRMTGDVWKFSLGQNAQGQTTSALQRVARN